MGFQPHRRLAALNLVLFKSHLYIKMNVSQPERPLRYVGSKEIKQSFNMLMSSTKYANELSRSPKGMERLQCFSNLFGANSLSGPRSTSLWTKEKC